MGGVDRRLTGLCVHCGERIAWPGPDGVVFADFSEAHTVCYRDFESERQRALAEARGERFDPAALLPVEAAGGVGEGGPPAAEAGCADAGEEAGALFSWAAEGEDAA